MKSIREMFRDAGAQSLMGMKISELVELCVGLIVVAALVPVAISMFFDAEITEAFEAYPMLERIWNLIPMMVILAIAISVIYGAIKTTKME